MLQTFSFAELGNSERPLHVLRFRTALFTRSSSGSLHCCQQSDGFTWPTHLGVEHREEGVEAFRQEGVREDRVRHGGVSELAQHGDLDHGHDLAAFTAEDRAAQDLPAVRVDDGLYEAARLPGLDGPDDGAHRELRHPDRASLRPGLALGHADAAKLRVDEHRVRDDPVARARLLVPDEVGVQNAVIVVGKSLC